MNKLVFISISLLVMALGCKDDDEDEVSTGLEVQMGANSFLPQTLTITAGTAVRWVNSSQVDHTVTSSDGFFDEYLSPGGSYTHTFTTAGTYNYVCTIHAGMAGVIIVD